MTGLLIVLAALALLVFGAWARFRWFAVLDSPDGERYQRRRMQGPFVPVVDEYDEHDGRRPATDPRDQG